MSSLLNFFHPAYISVSLSLVLSSQAVSMFVLPLTLLSVPKRDDTHNSNAVNQTPGKSVTESTFQFRHFR